MDRRSIFKSLAALGTMVTLPIFAKTRTEMKIHTAYERTAYEKLDLNYFKDSKFYHVKNNIQTELAVQIIGRPKVQFEEIKVANPDGSLSYRVGNYKFLPLEFLTDEETLNYMIYHPATYYRIENDKEYWALNDTYVTYDKKHLSFIMAHQIIKAIS